MKFLRHLADYWYVYVLFLGSLVGFHLYRKRGIHADPAQALARELRAVAAKREVREMEISLGVQAAKQHVEDKYREQLAQLDEETRAQATSLEQDPAELAKFLERLTR